MSTIPTLAHAESRPSLQRDVSSTKNFLTRLFQKTSHPIGGNPSISPSALQDWEIVTMSTPDQDATLKTSLYEWRGQNTANNIAADRFLDFIENPTIMLNLEDLELNTLPNIFSHPVFQSLKQLDIRRSAISQFPETFQYLKVRDSNPLTLIIHPACVQLIPDECCLSETKALMLEALSKLTSHQKLPAITLLISKDAATLISDKTLIQLVEFLLINKEFELAKSIANTIADSLDKKPILEQINLSQHLVNYTSNSPSTESTERSMSTLSINSSLDVTSTPTLEHYQRLYLQLSEDNPPRRKLLQCFQKLSPEIFSCIKKGLLTEIDEALASNNLPKTLYSRLQTEIELATERSAARLNRNIPTGYELDCLSKTIDSLIDNCKFQEGLDLVDQILSHKDLTPSYKIGALTYIIEGLIDNNHFSEAAFLTQKIPEGIEKSNVLQTTITSFIQHGQLQAAMDSIHFIVDPQLKDTQLIKIIDVLITQGDPEQALKILDGLSTSTLQSHRLLGIIDSFIQKRELQKALEIMQKVPADHPDKSTTLKVLIDAAIESGSLDQVVEMASHIQDEHLLVAVADILINKGEAITAIKFIANAPVDVSTAQNWQKI